MISNSKLKPRAETHSFLGVPEPEIGDRIHLHFYDSSTTNVSLRSRCIHGVIPTAVMTITEKKKDGGGEADTEGGKGWANCAMNKKNDSVFWLPSLSPRNPLSVLFIVSPLLRTIIWASAIGIPPPTLFWARFSLG